MNESETKQLQTESEAVSVVVIGGGGGWGKRVVDVSKTLSCVSELKIIEKDDDPNDFIDVVKRCDVIFLASPDLTINDYLIEMQSILGPGKAIIDCATNKNDFASKLTEIAHAGTSVCSTHPMVMPETASRGHNVLIMPLGTNPGFAKDFALQIYKNMGMNIIEDLDFDSHSDVMAIIQMVPHLVQRIMIEAMGQALKEHGKTIEDVSQFAPANYMLAELGVGRVGIQRPDISAGIIATALQTEFGKKILRGILDTLEQISAAGDDRGELSRLFEKGATRLDPQETWRARMREGTDAALSRLGNLKHKSFKVSAKNERGILRDILTILADHEIDITAMDSHILTTNDDTTSSVTFDIGIADRGVDYDSLLSDLQEINVSLKLHDE